MDIFSVFQDNTDVFNVSDVVVSITLSFLLSNALRVLVKTILGVL